MMLRRAGVLGVCLGLLWGCGLRHRVDADLLAPIPPEDKLALFDAENDVLIAKDERVASLADKEDAQKALEEAEKDASNILKRAGSERDPKLAGMLRAWAKAKLAWRQAEVDLAEVRRDAAADALTAARARYERAKAQVLKERAPRKATDITLADFNAQVKDREADAASGLKAAQRVMAQRDKHRAAYDAVSRQLQEQSGGAYGGPWAD